MFKKVTEELKMMTITLPTVSLRQVTVKTQSLVWVSEGEGAVRSFRGSAWQWWWCSGQRWTLRRARSLLPKLWRWFWRAQGTIAAEVNHARTSAISQGFYPQKLPTSWCVGQGFSICAHMWASQYSSKNMCSFTPKISTEESDAHPAAHEMF